MNLIRILPENVASQIAAGEVIDRPASVVRELVDNSIDAGADRVLVRIESGGKGLIKINDNGSGMSRDDLLLCIERHATSKIESAADLYAVRSLGFRGEAIPSIASVSRMRITSRPRDQLEGNRLKISGGKLTAIDETGAPAGTTVEVLDLFYNLPARRKFLRSARTEMNHITDTFSRSVLPYPNISFKLEESGKTILNFPAAEKIQTRLFSLMGRNVAKGMIEFEAEHPDVKLRVHLGPPELNRSRGDRLFVYVNGRNIRDRLINKAIMEGYGQRLMKGRYPQAAVFMDIEPANVDVNVHPTKQEVKFHNSSAVFQHIVSTIEKALSHTSHVFFSRDTPKQSTYPVSDHAEPSASVSEGTNGYDQQHSIPHPSVSTAIHDYSDSPLQSQKPSLVSEGPEVIGQLGSTYILCQTRDGFLMVDQHAAHERIVYETLKSSYNTSHLEIQALLLPHKLELSARETNIALSKIAELSRMGIELEHFGGNTFILRSHPAILKDVHWESFLSELVAGLEEGEPEDEAVLDRLLTVMACHGAVRAGYRMTHQEMVDLLRQLEDMDLPTNCPHGRPVFRHFTYYEIEKMFKRVV